ncbi:unnamed protein product [Didymodactylos carnosus]|uniref:Uncharacterized protein n=1 Tax=Didymodactylos carnosus TaxID=1234261 RepID=A0A815D421_9BILA|nr:unnamed protein product [Didymodactylos carnosus]CAF1370003.1 unnamed protein product [Didymodactylos carnosus]CAF4099629.1 unnamed protein product [Didymodactylos carnosus]CAF4179248.1 unnamed protein product [Didymodactylos carnosus]
MLTCEDTTSDNYLYVGHQLGELIKVNIKDLIQACKLIDENLPTYEERRRIIIYGIKYTRGVIMMTNKNHFPKSPALVKVTNMYIQQQKIIFRGTQYCVMGKYSNLAAFEIFLTTNESFFSLYDISYIFPLHEHSMGSKKYVSFFVMY